MRQSRITPADTEIGRRLRLLRIDRNISQTEIAERLGLTFQQVQKYEKGTNRIAAGRLQEVANFFEVPVSFFFENPKTLTNQAVTAFNFLNTAQALRLVKAFSKIADETQRSALVTLAESMASRARG